MSRNKERVVIGGLITFASGILVLLTQLINFESTVGEEFGQLFHYSKMLITFLCGFSMLIGVVNVFAGLLSVGNGDLSDCLSSNSSSISFVYFHKKSFRSLEVDISNLSKRTQDTIVEKVETPLYELYKLTLKSKRAEEVYKSVSSYIVTVGEDLRSAIAGCKNEMMENALIDRLCVVEQFINGLKDDIDNAIKTDSDEKAILENLELEGYRPLSLTEELNKLI